MSKWGNGYNDFVNNCELSAIEDITSSFQPTMSKAADYDGYFFITINTSSARTVNLNNTPISIDLTTSGKSELTIPINKGDVVSITGDSSPGELKVIAFYYKKRDYSNR